MDLDEAVTRLYASDLADFVATRTRLATEADREDARAIKALRKPTVTAWLLNLLARREPDLVGEVGALGGRMRAAQAKGDAQALRESRPERDDLVRRVVDAVRAVAQTEDRALTPAAEDEVRASLVAALADADGQAALASGMLVRPLSYSGFGEVDLDDAVAARARLRLVQGDGEGQGADRGDEGPPSERSATVSEAAQDAQDAERAAAERMAQQRLHEAEVRLATLEGEVALARRAAEGADAALAAARELAEQSATELAGRLRQRDAAAKKLETLRRARFDG